MTETTIVAQQLTAQIAKALENLQISTKTEEVPDSKMRKTRREIDPKILKIRKILRSQKLKNLKSEEPQKRQKNPRRPRHTYQPRSRAMKAKLSRRHACRSFRVHRSAKDKTGKRGNFENHGYSTEDCRRILERLSMNQQAMRKNCE